MVFLAALPLQAADPLDPDIHVGPSASDILTVSEFEQSGLLKGRLLFSKTIVMNEGGDLGDAQVPPDDEFVVQIVALPVLHLYPEDILINIEFREQPGGELSDRVVVTFGNGYLSIRPTSDPNVATSFNPFNKKVMTFTLDESVFFQDISIYAFPFFRLVDLDVFRRDGTRQLPTQMFDLPYEVQFLSADQSADTPEPSSLVLLGSGTLGMLGYRWLRRRRPQHRGRAERRIPIDSVVPVRWRLLAAIMVFLAALPLQAADPDTHGGPSDVLRVTSLYLQLGNPLYDKFFVMNESALPGEVEVLINDKDKAVDGFLAVHGTSPAALLPNNVLTNVEFYDENNVLSDRVVAYYTLLDFTVHIEAYSDGNFPFDTVDSLLSKLDSAAGITKRVLTTKIPETDTFQDISDLLFPFFRKYDVNAFQATGALVGLTATAAPIPFEVNFQSADAPEPSSLVLLGSGTLGMLGYRWLRWRRPA